MATTQAHVEARWEVCEDRSSLARAAVAAGSMPMPPQPRTSGSGGLLRHEGISAATAGEGQFLDSSQCRQPAYGRTMPSLPAWLSDGVLWMRQHMGSRDAVISIVSDRIQNSPEAWAMCLKVIVFLSLAHLCVQTWFALPSYRSSAAPATLWQTSRRLCLAQVGFTALVATASLHWQVRGLVGVEGIIPFMQHATERIRRYPPSEELLQWEVIRKEPIRWLLRCANVLEARWWARGHHTRGGHAEWWGRDGSDGGLTDAKLTGLCWLGEVASLLVIFLSLFEGLGSRLAGRGAAGLATELCLGAVRCLALLCSTFCYRVLRSCTGVFTGLQWDSLLLEVNLLAVPLAVPLLPNCWVPSLMLPMQVCAFKCMFGSGVVKRRSRCPRWAASTAMDLHYETQPIPNLVSWYMHKLPGWWHAYECWIAFWVQLPFTFLQWGIWYCRVVAVAGYTALMCAIAATGNYGFFNFQVLFITMSVLDDSALPFSFPAAWDPVPDWAAMVLLPGAFACGLLFAAASGLALLQLPRLGGIVNTTPGSLADSALSVAQKSHEALYPIGIGHSYGPFAGMTTFRWELIFELSSDGEQWVQLEFPYKPGCIDTRPQWMPIGHFARLDWRLWFVPLGMGRGRWDLPTWVAGFAGQLLKGSPPVAALTRSRDSIVASPPKFVRVSVWDYHFSSCNPTVHQCSQVSFSRADRDAAYVERSWWEAPAVANRRGDAVGAAERTGPSSPAPGSARLGRTGGESKRQRVGTEEWGRWWYRRLVARCGVYSLREGQLQFWADEGRYRY